MLKEAGRFRRSPRRSPRRSRLSLAERYVDSLKHKRAVLSPQIKYVNFIHSRMRI